MSTEKIQSTIFLLEQPRSREYILQKIKDDPSEESQTILPYLQMLTEEPSAIRHGFTGLQGSFSTDEVFIPSVATKQNPLDDFICSKGSLRLEAALHNSLPSIIAQDNQISDNDLNNIWNMEGSIGLNEDDNLVIAVDSYRQEREQIRKCSQAVGKILASGYQAGTGFIVNHDGKKFIMTCAHVVCEIQNYSFFLGGVKYPLIKQYCDEKMDVAIFSVSNSSKNLPDGLIIPTNLFLPVNAPCVTIGYPMNPHGQEDPKLISKKFPGVLGVKRHSIGLFHRTTDIYIGHTTNTLKGSSGAPIIALDQLNKTKVLGMNRSAGNVQMNCGIDSKVLLDCLSKLSKPANLPLPSTHSPSKPSQYKSLPSASFPHNPSLHKALPSPLPSNPTLHGKKSSSGLLGRICLFFKSIWDTVSRNFQKIKNASNAFKKFFRWLESCFSSKVK